MITIYISVHIQMPLRSGDTRLIISSPSDCGYYLFLKVKLFFIVQILQSEVVYSLIRSLFYMEFLINAKHSCDYNLLWKTKLVFSITKLYVVYIFLLILFKTSKT